MNKSVTATTLINNNNVKKTPVTQTYPRIKHYMCQMPKRYFISYFMHSQQGMLKRVKI